MRTTNIDDFIEQINTMSKQELYEQRVRHSLDVERIKQQLTDPFPNQPPDWRIKAQSALSFKQIELDYINTRINDMNQTCSRFIDVAKLVLDHDTFNVILERART